MPDIQYEKIKEMIGARMAELSTAIDTFLIELFKRRMGFGLVIFDTHEGSNLNVYISNVAEKEDLKEALKTAIDMIDNDDPNNILRSIH